jgi:hypothetical protein
MPLRTTISLSFIFYGIPPHSLSENNNFIKCLRQPSMRKQYCSLSIDYYLLFNISFTLQLGDAPSYVFEEMPGRPTLAAA